MACHRYTLSNGSIQLYFVNGPSGHGKVISLQIL
nr:MAG TPA: hypothetical protein [Caudoviricetes sp.]